MDKYITPILDSILIGSGWYRPNEACLYVRKLRKEEEMYKSFRYKVARAGDWFYSMEDWPWTDPKAHPKAKGLVAKGLELNGDITYVAGDILQESILMITADFWHWEFNAEMEDKYAKLYEAFSGNKYNHPGFYKG